MEEFHESSVVLPLGKYHSTSTIASSRLRLAAVWITRSSRGSSCAGRWAAAERDACTAGPRLRDKNGGGLDARLKVNDDEKGKKENFSKEPERGRQVHRRSDAGAKASA